MLGMSIRQERKKQTTALRTHVEAKTRRRDAPSKDAPSACRSRRYGPLALTVRSCLRSYRRQSAVMSSWPNGRQTPSRSGRRIRTCSSNLVSRPGLRFTSPERGCGKTTLLDVLARLVPRPLPTANATAAAIFRMVEAGQPTLLIDEADTFLRENEELRGILNSGHRRGGAVIRTVGDDHEPRAFATFAPCAIALIGKLPATLADRSVPVELRRRRDDEHVEPFRFDRTEHLDVLARKLARWTADNADCISGADPEMPTGVFNRVADNWRPLLAIADSAGADWSARARHALQCVRTGTADDDSSRVMLLADIRVIFTERDADRLASAELVASLVAIEGRPWAEWKVGKPLTANGLARVLAPFRIAPATIRTNDGTAKGYQWAQFEDVFARYLPAQAV
jgi:hypothetical protein